MEKDGGHPRSFDPSTAVHDSQRCLVLSSTVLVHAFNDATIIIRGETYLSGRG